MNEGLELYKNDNKVASIHAYVYPTQKNSLKHSSYKELTAGDGQHGKEHGIFLIVILKNC